VIWTENSISSDWVQSEAGRAHADRKLIPVKAKGLSYQDIPPPFDNMHIENLGDREKILAALVAQLAKPETQRPAVRQLATRARFQVLSWFGILGAVITLTSNLQALLTLSRWMRALFESWTAVLVLIWRKILFFLPQVYALDAIVLTLISFAAVNVFLCSRRDAAGPRRIFTVVIASLVIVSIFAVGLGQVVLASKLQAPGYYREFAGAIDELLGSPAVYLGEILLSTSNVWTILFVTILIVLYALITYALVPLLPVTIVYAIARQASSFRLSSAALSYRLWRIIVGIGLLISANYLSLWIEHEPWFTQIMSR
jgi:hypothetical protein